MVLNELIPTNVRSQILTSLDRITQPISDFIRGNPIVSTAALGIGTTGLIATAATIIRKRKKKTGKKKRKAKRRVSRRRIKKRKRVRKKITHRSPRHKGHKKVIFTTKEGKKVSFLVRKKDHKHKRRKKRT